MFPINLTSIRRRGSLLSAAVAALALPTIAAPVWAAADDSSFQDARSLYAHKFYKEAIPKLQAYLNQNPTGADAPQAEFTLAGAFVQTKDWQNAAPAFSRFLEMNKDEADRPAAEYYLGEAYNHLKESQKAIDAYHKFLDMNKGPENRPYAEAHLGDNEYRIADASGAIAHYRAAAAAFRMALAEPAAKNQPTVLAYSNYWLGESLYQAKDLAGAAQAFNTVIQQYPQSQEYGDALLGRGVALAASDDPNDKKAAAAALQQVADKFPGSTRAADALSALAVSLYARQDYPGAASAYQKLLDNAQGGSYVVDALDGLAWSRFKQDQFAQAAPLFEKVALKSMDKKTAAEAVYLAGLSYLKSDDAEKAQAAWQPLIADPSNSHAADASYSLAHYHADKKEWPAAITQYRSFVTAFPNDKRTFFAYAAMGDAATQTKDYATAADAYGHAVPSAPDAAIKLKLLTGQLWADEHAKRTDAAAAVRAVIKRDFPNSAVATESTVQEADAAYEKADYKTALAGYGAFLQGHGSDPDAGRVTYRAGFSQLKLGNVPEAAALFDQLSTRHAEPALVSDALTALSAAYLKGGDYGNAAATYTKLITTYPKGSGTAAALYNRATAYAKLEKWDLAAKDYSQVAQDYPTDKTAQDAAYWAAWIEQKHSKAPEEAIAADRKYLAQFPNSTHAADTYLGLGNLLASSKKYTEAAAAWDAVVTKFPTSSAAPTALLNRAVAMEKQNNTAEALKSFALLRADYPKAAETESATFELARLKVAKNPDEAGALFDEFRQTYPDSQYGDQALFGSALVRYNSKKYAEAAPLFQKIAAKYPDTKLTDSGFWAAESFRKAGRLEQALPLYEEYLKNHPADKNTAAAYLGAGISALRTGSYEGALTHLKAAQAANDTDFGARAALYEGEVFLAQHKATDARDSFLKELTHDGYADPDLEGEAEYGLAQSYETLQQWSDAREQYTKAAAAANAGDWAAKAKTRLTALKVSHPG